jgi:hypothetical protein
MTWLDEQTIPIGRGQSLSPFWHCFGANSCKIELATIVSMLMHSRTMLLPINTHDPTRPLIIGDGNVTWQQLQKLDFVRRLVPCLNINLRISYEDAVTTAHEAFQATGIELLKLEVLEPELKVSNDTQLVRAAGILMDDGFRILPLITANLDAARELVKLGVPLLRVQGSPIGSGHGIYDPDALRAIISLGVPVILDCGIGTADHVKQAMQLGCAGFLVDYLLFKNGEPVEAVRQLRADLEGKETVCGDPFCIADHEGEEAWQEWFDHSRV